MAYYIIKLLLLLPLMGGMIFGALWLYRKYQPALLNAQKRRSVQILETLPLGNFSKLTVIQFEGRKILLSVSRSRVDLLAKGDDAS